MTPRRPARFHSGGGGCLTLLLAFILLIVWIGSEDPAGLNVPLDSEYADPRSPRRPLPGGDLREEFVIEDTPMEQDSQGTAFAIDRDGVWMTAEHVSASCARIALVEGRDFEPVERAINSRSSDTALLIDGPLADDALPLATRLPSPGDPGYHMGFPSGEEGMVTSSYMGSATARRGVGGSGEAVLVWAEEARDWINVEPLGGISGGPTLLADGRVIGVNSASSERRGRVLTSAPADGADLIAYSQSVDENPNASPLPNRRSALSHFRALLDRGIIRLVWCDV